MADDLPAPSRDLMTAKRIPPSLRGTIYEAMVSAVSDELSAWRDEIRREKTSLYDIDSMDEDAIRRICALLGVPLFADVSSGIGWLREEARAIPFKLAYKGTPTLYKSFIRAVGRDGEMFIYEYRKTLGGIAPVAKSAISCADGVPLGEPFKIESAGDFSGIMERGVRLDTGKRLDLADGGGAWHLDEGIFEISTNHIGLEYFIDRVIERRDGEFLMTSEYLNYLGGSMDWARRAKEVPHIGSQLSIQVAATGRAEDNGEGWTIPSLHLKAAARADFFDIITSRSDFSSVEFGVGSLTIPSKEYPDAPFPQSLKERVRTVRLDSATGFVGDGAGDSIGVAMAEYVGQSLNDFVVSPDGGGIDGERKEFEFMLPYAPLRKGSVRLSIHLPDGTEADARDDGCGSLSSDICEGAIDYASGRCSLSTSFVLRCSDRVDDVDVLDKIDGRTYTGKLRRGCVVPGSAWLRLSIGGEALKLHGEDDGGGIVFTHEKIISARIERETGKFEFSFSDDINSDGGTPFVCRYDSRVDRALPAGTVVTASYFFTERTVLITEAGLCGKDGTLVAYATFPPFEFTSNAHHLSLTILARRAT